MPNEWRGYQRKNSSSASSSPSDGGVASCLYLEGARCYDSVLRRSNERYLRAHAVAPTKGGLGLLEGLIVECASIIHNPRLMICFLVVMLGVSQRGMGEGPDVLYTDCQSIWNYGAIEGIRGYAIDSYTCNVGTEDLLWGFEHDGVPALAMNAYRLLDGRLEQIGMSWVKHSCCAFAGDGCGIECNGNDGSMLGVGCRDVYGAAWNGGQHQLGLRSDINALTGEVLPATGGAGDEIFKRLQIAEADLEAPEALYFIEGVYVSPDDAQAGNALNNASYKRVTVGGSFNLTPVDDIFAGSPAIFAWQDHGLGVGSPDDSVQIMAADLPDEGRFLVAGKASELGEGLWRYAYAVYNHNSHRSAGSFTVPLPAGATASGIGFHDVDYHSGEVYDNTDWAATVDSNGVRWSSPATYAQNPDSNALRWGTMYTFWFDVDAPPVDGSVTLGLFRPGAPASMSISMLAPSAGPPCPADFNGDGVVGPVDLATLLGAWGQCPGCPSDLDGDEEVGPIDLATILGAWGPCP